MLGFGGNVGAQQANFGTPEQKPGKGDDAWGAVNLDVNKDGVINDADLAAANMPTPAPIPPAPPPVVAPTTPAPTPGA